MDAIFDFVKNFTTTRYEDIPVAAVEAAKKEVLDSLATALGGSSQDGVGELVDMVKEWGGMSRAPSSPTRLNARPQMLLRSMAP